MPKCMHLVPGMTSLNTKKAKVKITKTRMLELRLEHKLHNKKYKHDKSLAHLMVMDFAPMGIVKMVEEPMFI